MREALEAEHRTDRRSHVSDVVYPNGSIASTADVRLTEALVREAFALYGAQR